MRYITIQLLILCTVVACASTNSEIIKPLQDTAPSTPIHMPTTLPQTIEAMPNKPTPTSTILPSVTTEPIQTLTASANIFPTNSISQTVLYAVHDDLWRVSISGDFVEQLTKDGLLGWGMDKTDHWTVVAVTTPPILSPDGRWMLVKARRSLQLINVEGKVEEMILGNKGTDVSWASNSQSFAYLIKGRRPPQEDQLFIYDIQRKEHIHLADMPMGTGGGIIDIIWSPDGSKIAFGCCFDSERQPNQDFDPGSVMQIDLNIGEVRKVGETGVRIAADSPALCWMEDGRVLSTIDNEFTSGKSLRCSYSFIPYHSYVRNDREGVEVYVEGDGDNTNISAHNIETNEVIWQRKVEGYFDRVAWSTDKRWLLLDDDKHDSPIWRLSSNGLGEFVPVVMDGYLIRVVEQWK